MLKVIISVVECILEFFASFAGYVCQFVSGVIFNSMDSFMGSDQNIIIKILSPVYNFSKNYLIPISFSLMIMIVVYSLVKIMFGRFSNSKDEPLTLLVRCALFGILIFMSTDIIGLIGGTSVVDGKSQPGIVIQMVSAMSDVGTSNDVWGSSKIKNNKQEKLVKNAKKTLNSGKQNVDDMLGYTSAKSDSDTGTEYSSKKIDDNSSVNLGAALTESAVDSTFGNFVVYFCSIALYALIYGFLILLMAWKCLKICSRFVYRFVIFLVLLYMCPLIFACAPSHNTQRTFEEWLKMILSYAVMLVLTAAFMRLGLFVIFESFKYSVSSNLIQVIFSFLVSIMFLKMIYELEKYVEKLGFTAVGLPDSVSGLSKTIGGLGHLFTYSLMREGVKGVFDKVKSIPSNPEFSVNNPINKNLEKALNQGKKVYDKDGKVKNKLASEMLGKANDKAFVSNPTGDNLRGTDGVMYDSSEFVEDKDGNLVLKNNENVMAQNPHERYSQPFENEIDTEGLDGVDGSCNAFTDVKDMQEGTAAVTDEDGDYFMTKSDSGNIAIKKSDLDENNTTEYAIKPDENGNYKATEWQSEKDGDKFRVGKKGNLVNVGDGQRYKIVNAGNKNIKDSIPVNYTTTTGEDTSYCLNAKSGRIENKVQYNANLPRGAKISAVNNLEYCSTLYEAKDGTTTGIARQMITDPNTGKLTGESRYVKFTRYDNNEISKDEIARHRASTNRAMSDRNPCEGYTPDGKHYIHIEKYMGERKKPQIQKYR